MKRYDIAEIFYSIQGEGVRAGEPSVFVRFAGCNIGCTKKPHGFDCDTDHRKRISLTAEGISNSVLDLTSMCRWVVLTGGEPSMQADADLTSHLKGSGFRLAIETNGTRALPPGFDWITVSPKFDTVIRQRVADEVKYVVKNGDPLPNNEVDAPHRLLSPAAEGSYLPPENVDHCVQLCLKNPAWRLSVQAHKLIHVK